VDKEDSSKFEDEVDLVEEAEDPSFVITAIKWDI
jgi:hypothetical protein